MLKKHMINKIIRTCKNLLRDARYGLEVAQSNEYQRDIDYYTGAIDYLTSIIDYLYKFY